MYPVYYNYSNGRPECQAILTLEEKDFENNEGKGENAGNQPFLLFPQCFLLLSLPDDKILDWSKLKQIADDVLKCI